MMSTSKIPQKRDGINKKVAELYGVSMDYVSKVRRGDREDDEIFSAIMEFIEAEQGVKSKLIVEIQTRIPFDGPEKAIKRRINRNKRPR